MRRLCKSTSLTVAMILGLTSLVAAQEKDKAAEAEAFAKQLSNPVADLVSLPLQFNWENGVGPQDELRFLVNFQPVVPFALNEKWNLIGRFILPVLSQPPLASGGETHFGTSDIVLSGFFSPAKSSGAIWGIGPVFGLPTTTDPFLGSGTWQIGPTGVILKQSGPWTFGGLVNHLWSFADTGDTDRADVSRTFLQPFVAYTTKKGVTVTVNSESTADWEAAEGEEWTVPINFLASKITKLGPFPFSIGGGAGVFIEQPTGGPEWKLRTVFTLILPKSK